VGKQALQKAAKGEADGEVLEEIRKGYEEVKSRYYMRKTNLAAVLLDVANRQAKIEDWTAMYKEAQTLSRQLLAVFPTDTDAQANLRAATNSLKMRTQQAGGQAAEDGDVSQARRLLSDDDDEEDDDADQEGDSDAPAGGKPPGGWNTASGDQRAAMTYAEAMQRAQQGKADEEVLAIFRNELEKAKDTGNAETIKTHKANLAALIIDIAKNEAEPRVWRPMYAESIELSEQVLEFFPDDATAKANKQAAEAWLAHRTSKLEKMEEAEFLSLMEERPGPATHGGAPAPPSDGLTEEERARRMLLDDDDEDDDGKEEL
jgi:hypothetical protein